MSLLLSLGSVFFFSLQVLAEKPGHVALTKYPLIDGHNDLAYNLYHKLNNQIDNFHFEKNLTTDPIFGRSQCQSCNTDLVRIKKGKLGAQFWSVFVDCDPKNSNSIVSRSLEQIDVIKRLIAKYPHDMELVTTADGIVDAFLRRRLASLIGLEGGHSIDSKMALLRQFYELGVRYMTLTQNCNLPWAESSIVDNNDNNSSSSCGGKLSDFGKKIILEMNRLGMIVDLSHTSHNAMNDAISVSKAPVIFSHSSAYSVFPHPRNVKDDILHKLQINGGIIMVNFYSGFLGQGYVTMKDLTRHINHIVDIIGMDHVGIGSDFDGVNKFPEGLEDVSKYPALFDLLAELDPKRWTLKNLEKLAGRNFYRVFKDVEKVRDKLSKEKPDESLIPEEDLVISMKKESERSGAFKRFSTLTSFAIVALLFLA